MQQYSFQIEVIAGQNEAGEYRIKKNNAPDALGSIRAADLSEFYSAVANKVFDLYPDAGLTITVKEPDGDVQQASWLPQATAA